LSELRKSPVLFCPAEPDSAGLGFGPHFKELIRKTVGELAGSLPGNFRDPWAVKIHLGDPGAPNPVLPEWMESAAAGLKAQGYSSSAVFENLSITTQGLDTSEGLSKRAASLGLASFQVGDDPSGPLGTSLSLQKESSLPNLRLSRLAAEAGGLLFLNSVRPHAHLGMGASLFALGSGVLDRESKILLHQDVRPSVDTPLCAGCGSCLASCIFDAIIIRSGRAFIDHQLCTGCGECMTACHLAGISPEDAGGIVRFQKNLAEAAHAVHSGSKAGNGGGMLHVNFLTPLPRQGFGGFGRDRFLTGTFGALLSADPVALDQATWDLLVKGAVHGLRQWSGFLQEPGPLMERAEALGLGSRQYLLETRS
jgi:uncharacterized protein